MLLASFGVSLDGTDLVVAFVLAAAALAPLTFKALVMLIRCVRGGGRSSSRGAANGRADGGQKRRESKPSRRGRKLVPSVEPLEDTV